MFKALKFLIGSIALFSASQAFSQAPTPLPVTGNLSQILGTPQPYAGISLQLQNCPAPITIPGTSIIVNTSLQIQADASGLINSTVWPVDVIDCNGTTGNAQYGLQYVVNGVPTADPVCYAPISSLGVWNLATLQSITCNQTPPAPGDVTYNNVNVHGLTSTNTLSANAFIGRLAWSYTNTLPVWLSWTNPVLNQSVSDTTTVVQSSSAPGDSYVTPVLRIVSSDSGINDTAPAYFYHNCNFTASSTSAPCVGQFVVAQNNLGDKHHGLWGSNRLAIQYNGTGQVFAPTYGNENNVFNMSNTDAGSPDIVFPMMGPIFGDAETIGGVSGSNGTAAYIVTDTNAGAYWWVGLYVQRAIYAAVEAGPVTGGSGLQYSIVSNPKGQASNTTNYGSVPQLDMVNNWNGIGSFLETLERSFIPGTGVNPINCYTYKMAGVVRQELCDDGSSVVHPTPTGAGYRVTPTNDGDTGVAFQVTNAANSSNRAYITKQGNGFFLQGVATDAPVQVGLVQFTAAGCSNSALSGTGTDGIFTIGANNCSVVITMDGAQGMTAVHGWTCAAHDRNSAAVLIQGESTSTTTTATIPIPSSATIGDVISFSCRAY